MSRKNATPRTIEYRGEKYLYEGKSRGYVKNGVEYSTLSKGDKKNKDLYLSRRFYEQYVGDSSLTKQGYTSYEEKSKYRKREAIPKAAKAHVNKNGYTYYTISFKTEKELKNYISKLSKDRIGYVAANVMLFNYDDGKEGASNVKMWSAITSYSDKSALKKQDFSAIVDKRFGEFNARVIKYEYRFTPINQN